MSSDLLYFLGGMLSELALAALVILPVLHRFRAARAYLTKEARDGR